MKNKLLSFFVCLCFILNANSQEKNTWSRVSKDQVTLKSRNTERLSFPKDLFLWKLIWINYVIILEMLRID